MKGKKRIKEQLQGRRRNLLECHSIVHSVTGFVSRNTYRVYYRCQYLKRSSGNYVEFICHRTFLYLITVTICCWQERDCFSRKVVLILEIFIMERESS